MKRVVLFCPYPYNEAPSQRFRFEQYLSILEKRGFKITLLPFYNQSTWKNLYNRGNFIIKGVSIYFLIFRQILKSLIVLQSNLVFIHREILPVGPPFIEWVIAKIFRKKIIYDFDDAIWLTDNKSEGWINRKIRWRSKVSSVCKWSYKVSCGNAYLAKYAKQFNNNVVIIPTTINTKIVISPSYKRNLSNSKEVIIGWTGSHSTLKYLQQIETVLQNLENQYEQVSFLIISDQPALLKLNRLTNITWNKRTEIEDLLKIDIGIMPLPDDEWTKGKCGFKALQYMALEIPCIASPVGVNKDIIQNGVNGFLCNTPDEWMSCFNLLLTNELYRIQIGRQGKTTVEKNYSTQSNSSLFLSLFT